MCPGPARTLDGVMSHTHDHHGHDRPPIAVLTGAGISTGGGIPDFREPNGVWTRDPAQAELLDIDAYMASDDVRARCWRMWRDHPVWQARATPAHRAIVELERADELIAVLTQNFDGLHQAAGQSPGLVVADRKLVGALIEERAGAKLDQHREEQDREDPPDQSQWCLTETLQSRSTGALSMYPTPRTVAIGALLPVSDSLPRNRLMSTSMLRSELSPRRVRDSSISRSRATTRPA